MTPRNDVSISKIRRKAVILRTSSDPEMAMIGGMLDDLREAGLDLAAVGCSILAILDGENPLHVTMDDDSYQVLKAIAPRLRDALGAWCVVPAAPHRCMHCGEVRR